MHHSIPRNLPTLEFLLSELGYSHKQAAKILHVSERTVSNWIKSGKEPYASRLALFWLTHWGYSIIHTAAHNDACRFAQLANAYKLHIQKLEAQDRQTPANVTTNETKAANDRIFRSFNAESVLMTRQVLESD